MTNQKWVFHYTEKDGGNYKLYSIKECISPKRTKPARELMQMLENDECYTCGYMTLASWEKMQK